MHCNALEPRLRGGREDIWLQFPAWNVLLGSFQPQQRRGRVGSETAGNRVSKSTNGSTATITRLQASERQPKQSYKKNECLGERMRSRSKGNNNMQAMGCFETDHAQPRSKSPKARAVQHSGQLARVQSVRRVQCKLASGGAQVGAVAGPGLPNDFRVKGGDGHGQLGSVKGPFLGQVYFCTASGWSQLCRSTPIRSPGSLRLTQNKTQNTQTTPPWEQMGRRGPRHSVTSRPGDPSDCNVFNWPALVLFGFISLFSRQVVCCVQLSMAGREYVSQSGHVTRR